MNQNDELIDSDYDEDEDYDNGYDNIDLNLPNYEKELVFQRLALFKDSDKYDYRTVLGKHLVRIQGWDSLVTNKNVQTKRVLSEIKILEKTLPCESSNSIFVVVNEKDMSQMQCIIFGSEGTYFKTQALPTSMEHSYTPSTY